jgi:hypothetical protein
MSIALVLQVLLALLRFPKQLGEFVRLLEDSPEEKRQKIAAQVSLWMKESAESERPIYDRADK